MPSVSRPVSPTLSNPTYVNNSMKKTNTSFGHWPLNPMNPILLTKYKIKLLQSRLDTIVSVLYQAKSLNHSAKSYTNLDEVKTTTAGSDSNTYQTLPLSNSSKHRNSIQLRKSHLQQELLRLYRIKFKLERHLHQKRNEQSSPQDVDIFDKEMDPFNPLQPSFLKFQPYAGP
ncbi:hypothetical protein HMI54_014747 [Coelomomyces lativittatus]|nr:hypothetical protein HMI56_004414 [Coelomomyces lativittatus]KAJ1513132.1 hypothetical protein HMI55_005878 [Coelomomyces lativittatus]KAJ1513727.1 hypothetical protein HMI54_014747 [Coelomomyces lativittatus]